MEVETQKPPISETWTRWEGQTVNGVFPLRRCLGSSDHSGVFPTEHAARNLPNVALKLVPAIPTLAESQLSHWRAAVGLTHSHLVRLLDTGRCQLGGSHYLYVVMDYAEQNLAQLLQHRALTEAEVREMLPMTLDALAYLHTRDLVHGQLKPSNVLVVDNQLALASDTIRPADEATASIGMLSIHNPPEARDGSFSAAGDIWALGVTLCQALTQRTPLRSSERPDLVVLPADIPAGLSDILRRCLTRNPAGRPSVADLQEWLKKGSFSTAAAAGVIKAETVADAVPVTTAAPVPSAAAVVTTAAPVPSAAALTTAAKVPSAATLTTAAPIPSAAAVANAAIASSAAGLSAAATGTRAEPVARADAPQRITIKAVIEREPPPAEVQQRRSFLPLIVGAVVVAAVGWGALSWYQGRPNGAGGEQGSAEVAQTPGSQPADQPSDAAAGAPASAGTPAPTAPTDTTPAVSPPNADSTPASGAPAVAAAVHEDIPPVPARARSTIHGHVKVTLRVTIDNSGAVINQTFVRPGPSKYFARLASEAAHRWRFPASPGPGARQALIRFDFSRSETTAHVVSRDPVVSRD